MKDEKKPRKGTLKLLKPKDPNKPGRTTKGKNSDPTYNIYNHNTNRIDEDMNMDEADKPISLKDMEELQSIEAKGELKPKEQRLIELYLSYPLATKWKLAKMAGFNCSSKTALCNAFLIVMDKYVSARDHKQIFRQVGIGEAQLALRIRELMMQDTNLTVALNACTLNAKCLGLTKDALDLAEGFAINVTRANTQTQPVSTGPQRRVTQTGEKEQEMIE